MCDLTRHRYAALLDEQIGPAIARQLAINVLLLAAKDARSEQNRRDAALKWLNSSRAATIADYVGLHLPQPVTVEWLRRGGVRKLKAVQS